MKPTALPLLCALLAAPSPAWSEGGPVSLAEGQILTLRFAREVRRAAVADPAIVAVVATAAEVKLTGLRGGRTSVVVIYEGEAQVELDVSVTGARRGPVAAAEAPLAALEVAVGQARTVPAAGAARLMLEDDGVARVRAEGEGIVVVGVSPGVTTLVVVDGAGGKTTYRIRVR